MQINCGHVHLLLVFIYCWWIGQLKIKPLLNQQFCISDLGVNHEVFNCHANILKQPVYVLLKDSGELVRFYLFTVWALIKQLSWWIWKESKKIKIERNTERKLIRINSLVLICISVRNTYNFWILVTRKLTTAFVSAEVHVEISLRGLSWHFCIRN